MPPSPSVRRAGRAARQAGEGLSGSSGVSVGGSFGSFASRQSGVFCRLPPGGGEDLVPDRVEEPPQPSPAQPSPSPARPGPARPGQPGRGSRPGRTWRTHQPGRSAADCSPPSAAALASPCLVSGAGPVSGPASPNPPPPPVTSTPTATPLGTIRDLVCVDFQAIPITRVAVTARGRPSPSPGCDGLAIRSTSRQHPRNRGRPTADCRLPIGDRYGVVPFAVPVLSP